VSGTLPSGGVRLPGHRCRGSTGTDCFTHITTVNVSRYRLIFYTYAVIFQFFFIFFESTRISTLLCGG